FVVVLVGLIAAAVAAYGLRHAHDAYTSSRAEADLAAAVEQFSQVRWPAGFIASDDETCPTAALCLKTASDPQEAVEQGLAALVASGFQQHPAICEGDFGLGTGCLAHARYGSAAIAVSAGHEPPAGSGSLVMI